MAQAALVDSEQAMTVVLHIPSAGTAFGQVRASVADDGQLGLELDDAGPSTPGRLRDAVDWLGQAGLDAEPPETLRGSLRGWLCALGLVAQLARRLELRGPSAERCWLRAGQLLATFSVDAEPSDVPEICLALLDLVPDGTRAQAWTLPRMLRDRIFEVLYVFVRRAWERAHDCPERHLWLGPLALGLQRQRLYRAPPAVMLNRLFEAVSQELQVGSCLDALPLSLLLEALLPEHSRGVARLAGELVTAPAFESSLGLGERVDVLRALGRAQELQGDKLGAAAAYELALGPLCAAAAWRSADESAELPTALRQLLPAAVVLIERLAALEPATAEETRADGLAALGAALEPAIEQHPDRAALLAAAAEALAVGLGQALPPRADHARREAFCTALCRAFPEVTGLRERLEAMLAERR
jgi:hypothetical protein